MAASVCASRARCTPHRATMRALLVCSGLVLDPVGMHGFRSVSRLRRRRRRRPMPDPRMQAPSRRPMAEPHRLTLAPPDAGMPQAIGRREHARRCRVPGGRRSSSASGCRDRSRPTPERLRRMPAWSASISARPRGRRSSMRRCHASTSGCHRRAGATTRTASSGWKATCSTSWGFPRTVCRRTSGTWRRGNTSATSGSTSSRSGGPLTFPPRLNQPRDSGLLYSMRGPDQIWPQCLEFQIMEHNVGDTWMLAGTGLTDAGGGGRCHAAGLCAAWLARAPPRRTAREVVRARVTDRLELARSLRLGSRLGERGERMVGQRRHRHRGRPRRWPLGRSPERTARAPGGGSRGVLPEHAGTPAPLHAATTGRGGAVRWLGPGRLAIRGRRKPRWRLVDGAMEVVPGTGDLRTRSSFGDVRLHVEFKVPASSPNAAEQDRGNSGVYLQGRYEVQVLDSFGSTLAGANDCGAIYGVKDADVNEAFPPGIWQSYDMVFRAARWSGSSRVAPARITVVLERLRGAEGRRDSRQHDARRSRGAGICVAQAAGPRARRAVPQHLAAAAVRPLRGASQSPIRCVMSTAREPLARRGNQQARFVLKSQQTETPPASMVTRVNKKVSVSTGRPPLDPSSTTVSLRRYTVSIV